MRGFMRAVSVVACLTLTACGAAELLSKAAGGLSPDGSLSGDTSVSNDAPAFDDNTSVAIASLTFMDGDAAVTLTQGETLALSLSVALSNGGHFEDLNHGFYSIYDHLNDLVLWYSSNANVAAVSTAGEITAVGRGSSTIKATLGNISTSIAVAVVDAKSQLTLTAFEFHQGDQRALGNGPVGFTLDFSLSDGTTFFNEPASTARDTLPCNLDFASQAEDVVVLDEDGVAWPVGNGTAALAVSCGEWSDAVTLAVTTWGDDGNDDGGEIDDDNGDADASEAVPLGLSITTAAAETIAGEELTLRCDIMFTDTTISSVSDAFVTPAGDVAHVTWMSSDDAIAAVANGVATFTGYGTVTFTADFAGLSDTVTFTVKAATDEPDSYWDRFLGFDDDIVISYGVNGGYNDHLLPGITHGEPQISLLHVVSLGSGGVVTVELGEFQIVDGLGPDFTVFENPIVDDAYGFFNERAQVEVSADGRTYHAFPCDAFDSEQIYDGCAGVGVVHPTADLLDPEASGGDVFDLGDVGLEAARFVRISDLNTCIAGDPTYETASGETLCAETGKQGFDLDAMVILNGKF